MKTNLSSSSISAIEKSQNTSTDNRSVSPSSSPRSSPKPSPRPQTKRDHSKSDTFLTINYNNKDQGAQRQDGSPSSQESGSRISQESGSRERLSSANIEISPPPQDCVSVIGKDKRERTKKKSSWFNFYPTYKSRSEDFKKLFKKVPDDERLVVDYSCALQKEILVQGRIYVTQNYLCFHANIFGWETNLTLKWKDVASIAKEKTALVIPNAILISTKSDRYFFTSFVSRDKTYVMLFRVWQNALMDQPMSAQEMWQWVHQSYGSELGLTSDDEDYIAPAVEEDKLSVRLSVESFSEEARGIIDSIMDPDKEDETGFSGSKISGSDSHIPTDVTDNSDSEHEKVPHTQQKPKKFTHSLPKPFLPPTLDSDDPDSNKNISPQNYQCAAPHEGKHLLDVVVPIHIDQLFTLLFTSSKFYLDFHAARKTTDLTQTPWTHNPLDNSKSRIVSLTMALGQTMGPKSAQVTETQTMLPCSKAGFLYCIDVETINAGVPYADSFVVLCHYCLKKVSETQSSLNVFAQIKYKKSVWGLVKGMIERNCYSGMEDYISHLSRALNAEGENVPELKRKSRRKRRLYNLPRSPSDEISNEYIVPLRKKSHTTESFFSSDASTVIVFSILLLLLLLNIMLYYKLWSLEDTPTYSHLDLQILKNPPQSHQEWLQLLQKQESLRNIEAQKWQKQLKNAIDHLRKAEESLNELKHYIQSAYTNNLSSLENEQKIEEVKEL